MQQQQQKRDCWGKLSMEWNASMPGTSKATDSTVAGAQRWREQVPRAYLTQEDWGSSEKRTLTAGTQNK